MKSSSVECTAGSDCCGPWGSWSPAVQACHFLMFFLLVRHVIFYCSIFCIVQACHGNQTRLRVYQQGCPITIEAGTAEQRTCKEKPGGCKKKVNHASFFPKRGDAGFPCITYQNAQKCILRDLLNIPI